MTDSFLPRTSPVAKAVDPRGIRAFVDGMESKGLGPHSFMILRGGGVVAEGWWSPFRREDIHLLYSLSKSFTSTAIGFAVAEGLLSLDDPVISFFPNDLPAEVSPNLAAMQIRHLLSMSGGHESEPPGLWRQHDDGVSWVRHFLGHKVVHEPGTHFLYNSLGTYMCSAILHSLTGQRLTDYLRTRLFEPLGMAIVTSEQCPAGIDVGGWGMSMTTESISKFGQLYLQKGIWENRQLLPEGWVELATASHVSNGDDPANDWQQGYGFQFWRCRHDCYRGDGAFGQNCIVIPQHDAVVVTTASNPDLGATLQLVWDYLLPAMTATNVQPDTDLNEHLAHLELSVPGDADLGGTPRGEFANDDLAVKIEETTDGIRLTETTSGRQVVIEANGKGWTEGSATIRWERAKLSARAARREGSSLVVRACELNSPFEITVTIAPHVGGISYSKTRFGDFGETVLPTVLLPRKTAVTAGSLA